MAVSAELVTMSVFRMVCQKAVRMLFAGMNDRTIETWKSSSANINDLLVSYLAVIRARSNEQYWNNSYAKKAVNIIKHNVVGASGIRLQCRFKKNDVFLTDVNRALEEEFERWAEYETCDVAGRLSWVEMQQLVMLNIVRDGEAIIRLVRGVPNRYGFSLQILEPALLDESFNREKSPGQNRVELGIELDDWNRPVAYHFKLNESLTRYSEHITLPAKDILHIFISEKANQRRGMPWLHAGLRELHMLHGYQMAELIGARVAASKMGFFTQSGSAKYTGDEEDKDGNIVTDAKPGSFETLPNGVDFKVFDPQHPAGNFAPFLKAMLRGIASGIGVGYHSVANDMESVNFSSLRAATLEERDCFMIIQNWISEHFCRPVYREWLQMSSLSGVIPVSFSELDRYRTPKWLPRRWAWVDPLKDVQANVLSIENNIKSRQDVCAEQGRDFEDVIAEQAQEKQIAGANGMLLKPGKEKKPHVDADSDEGEAAGEDSVPLN